MSDLDVSVVDYGLGNLYSVKQACCQVGLDPVITDDPDTVTTCDAVIIPGVGAFGRAMESLRERNLVGAIREAADSGNPVVGICLGAQLLVAESFEFGHHEGLGLISGSVRRLDECRNIADKPVPHVGWEPVTGVSTGPSAQGLLNGVEDDDYFYFVHSYCVETDEENVTAVTRYGNDTFCSAFASDNVVGFQFHPEKSGSKGLRIYRNLRDTLVGGGHHA